MIPFLSSSHFNGVWRSNGFCALYFCMQFASFLVAHFCGERQCTVHWSDHHGFDQLPFGLDSTSEAPPTLRLAASSRFWSRPNAAVIDHDPRALLIFFCVFVVIE